MHLQHDYSQADYSQVQTQEYSLLVSKYEYPHSGALLTALLPGLVKNFSSQEEVIKIAATRFSFFLQKGELTSGHPIIVYITKFEVRLVQLCPNWLTKLYLWLKKPYMTSNSELIVTRLFC